MWLIGDSNWRQIIGTDPVRDGGHNADLRTSVHDPVPIEHRHSNAAGAQFDLSYFPPMNAKLDHSPETVARGPKTHPDMELPKHFDWRDSGLILGAQNQYACGSCWAWASATALTDRYSIAQQKRVPMLSPTELLSCVNSDKGFRSAKCNGGLASEAGHFLERTPLVTAACHDYTWCTGNPGCKGVQQVVGSGSEEKNQLVPMCEPGACEDGSKYTGPSFKVKGGSTQLFNDIEHIKRDIYLHGPLVGNYQVYADFTLGSHQTQWDETKGIYINGASYKLKVPEQLASRGSDASQIVMGAHAVVIVGWGEDTVPGYGTVPYWIVRNSWGPTWNVKEKGFWKHAMHPLNKECAIDVPKISGSQPFGGAVTFLPDTPYKVSEPGKTVSGSGFGDFEMKYVVMFMAVILFLLIVYRVTRK